jgi:hypothetical protein
MLTKIRIGIMRRVNIFGVVATVLALGFWAAPAASASAADGGKSPITTGCTSGAHVVSSWSAVNAKYNQIQGRVDLMYSPGCQTNWVNIYGNVPGNTYEATILLGTQPGGGGIHARVVNVGSDYTYQVYAPGNSCVRVSWSITDNATGIAEASELRIVC